MDSICGTSFYSLGRKRSVSAVTVFGTMTYTSHVHDGIHDGVQEKGWIVRGICGKIKRIGKECAGKMERPVQRETQRQIKEEIKVKKSMRWIAGNMAAVMMTGCMVPGNVMAKESMQIPEGVFSWFLVQAYDAACSENGGKTDLWKNKIDGENTEDWILEKAKSYAREYLTIENKFEQAGLEFSATEEETLSNTVERYWNELGYGRYYADYQVEEEDFTNVLIHNSQGSKLYNQMQEEFEGSVTDEEILGYIAEHGTLVQYIAVPYTEALSEDATQAEKNAWIDTDALYEEYRQRLESGESIEDLMQEISRNTDLSSAGVGSSYVGQMEETLFLDSNSSLSQGFKAALAEAEEDEVVYFDDVAQYYQIIFVKKAFNEEWEGLEWYEDGVKEKIAFEKFEDQIRGWSDEIEIANESDLPDADEVEEMFS
ncbi:MAG: hypothetical protein MR543_10485 [Robinsoniella sp.]|nr:hypothetical protein [Robinsoniella sp.]